MRDHSVSVPGRLVIGSPEGPVARALIDRRPVHPGFDVGDEIWRIHGLVCVGPVADDVSHGAALDVVLRGADVVADVAAERAAAFADDLRRAGLTLWTPRDDQLDAVAEALLESLANGASVAQAARQCAVSVRSAHRRLADARRRIGVATNVQAIVAWRSRPGVADVHTN